MLLSSRSLVDDTQITNCDERSTELSGSFARCRLSRSPMRGEGTPSEEQIRAEIAALNQRVAELEAEFIELARRAFDRDFGEIVGDALAVGGLLSSFLTSGLSLLLSGLGAGWSIKKRIDKDRVRARVESIDAELRALAHWRGVLEGQLP